MSTHLLFFLFFLCFVIQIDYIMDMTKYRIPDSQRGHRPRLNPGEDTGTYTIKLPVSLIVWARKRGSEYVRSLLNAAKNAQNEQK